MLTSDILWQLYVSSTTFGEFVEKVRLALAEQLGRPITAEDVLPPPPPPPPPK